MASGIQRITRKELEELLKQVYNEKDFVGYLATWGDTSDKSSQTQVVLLNRSLTVL